MLGLGKRRESDTAAVQHAERMAVVAAWIEAAGGMIGTGGDIIPAERLDAISRLYALARVIGMAHAADTRQPIHVEEVVDHYMDEGRRLYSKHGYPPHTPEML